MQLSLFPIVAETEAFQNFCGDTLHCIQTLNGAQAFLVISHPTEQS